LIFDIYHMALLKPDLGSFARIKVVGVGGGGGNALNTMVSSQSIAGVDFIAVNTDSQALLANHAAIKLQIGENITRGLGSGADPEIGHQAAEESREKIKEKLVDSDMIFITCGMGGGTGTGASPIIAEVSKELGALTVAIVTKPFAFEGTRRMVVAEEGIEELKDKVDTLIVIPNQRLLDVIDRQMTLLEAFKVADSVLSQGVQGISDIITVPGLINVDFADVKAVMQDAGSALMGIGTGTGDNRSQLAARAAVSSPLLEISIEGAKGILFNITGGTDLTMSEVDEAAQIISKAAASDANIIFGATIDQQLKDEVRMTVIATGFDETQARLSGFITPPQYQSPKKPPVSSDQPTSSDHPPDHPSPPSSPPTPPTKTPPSDSDIPPEELGEDLDIPAFLRRTSKS
jgi:cell division protein FtsZ